MCTTKYGSGPDGASTSRVVADEIHRVRPRHGAPGSPTVDPSRASSCRSSDSSRARTTRRRRRATRTGRRASRHRLAPPEAESRGACASPVTVLGSRRALAARQPLQVFRRTVLGPLGPLGIVFGLGEPRHAVSCSSLSSPLRARRRRCSGSSSSSRAISRVSRTSRTETPSWPAIESSTRPRSSSTRMIASSRTRQRRRSPQPPHEPLRATRSCGIELVDER